MISSYLELLQTDLGDALDADKREYFNFAIDGAKRMDAMMLGLLEYSRVGRKGEPPVWLDTRAVLDEALLFLRPLIDEAQADLRIEGAWPRFFGSPDEMLRLLQNLLGNALKFRVAGRVPEITVRSEATSKDWQLCVSDNGVGIAPEQIARLFQVFQRLQSRAAFEGTGIGLALCRKIAEHHGGRIWAESPGEDQGSRFSVALPLQQEQKAPT
jgi:signal transduction histidine kinase